MIPITGQLYWVITFFGMEYSESDQEIYVLKDPLNYQEAWITKANCLESGKSDSVMYLFGLEEDGLPFSANKFIIPNDLIFEDLYAARRLGTYLRDKYLHDTVKERMKLSGSIGINIVKMAHGHGYLIPFFKILASMAKYKE